MTEKQKSGVNKVTWNFGQYTSIHALPRIIQTKSTFAKVVWCIIFILACAIFAFNISTIVSEYLAYPTVQTTWVIQGHPMFPSVTVCNANPLRRSKLTGTLASKYGGPAGDSSSRKKRSAPGSTLFNAKMEFLSLAAGLSESERQSMEHQKKDLIIQCTYDGKACEEKDFEYYHDSLYGACFTYNKDAEKRVNKLGPFAGLDLTLNIEEGEYLNDVTATYGAVVAFHASGTLPPVQERPLYISPGHQTSVIVSQHNKSFLAAPYGNCMDDALPIEECISQCLAEVAEDRCGCKSPLYTSNGDVCGTEKVECLAAAMETDLYYCDCPSPCQENVYKYMMSSTKWPTINYESILEQSVSGISDSLDRSIENGTLRDNLLNLKVSFQWLEIEKTTSSPATTLSTMLTSIGVASVIFIGCSIISYIEFLELLFLLFASAICKRRGAKDIHV